ncbi:pyrimidine 5'-nucleotidase [Kordiimonas pumila]|uniref:Pyrimidine 5'-nucleotidase n=1 Tax=Kordiimonas pumila TaxID=2161677 RepID=A0ABV7CZW0_9PROT|nr:pyrimidine 5'-nucleotidase [Kordiimonas pumila]
MQKNIQSPYHPVFESHRATWVFDLDNTLYAAECDLFSQIDRNIGSYVESFLGLDPVAARKVQKQYLVDHGTTLKGLMANYKVNPVDYLERVHDIDFSPIQPNPKLRAAIQKLDGKKLIFTNADKLYSEKVIKQLGIEDLFDGIFDIIAADLNPKPMPEVYEKFIRDHGVKPEEAVMFEDMARNLKPAHEMGMATVWIDTGSKWGKIGHDPAIIHAETTSLSDWLTDFVIR